MARGIALALAAMLAVAGCSIQVTGTTGPVVTEAPATQAAVTQAPSQAAVPTEAPTQIVTPTAAPTSAYQTFGDGTSVVGTDIQPGTYRTRVASTGCYFARLSGFGGTLDDIITNQNTDFPWVVTIAKTDKGFESTNCGTWTSDLSPITSSRTSFDDGVYIVGTDMTAGTYKSSGEAGCYWARLSGFGGTLGDIIANANTDTPAIVTISAKDKGFASNGCGTWTKQ